MRLTLRLSNDNYIDVGLDIAKRQLILLSPVPEITESQLLQLSDDYHFEIILPLTGTLIEPDTANLSEDEIKNYTVDTDEALAAVLTFANLLISEN